MNAKEMSLLVAQLHKENESNSPEDKEFNLKWIQELKKSMIKALQVKDLDNNKIRNTQR